LSIVINNKKILMMINIINLNNILMSFIRFYKINLLSKKWNIIIKYYKKNIIILLSITKILNLQFI
jgi:hypothetical protein